MESFNQSLFLSKVVSGLLHRSTPFIDVYIFQMILLIYWQIYSQYFSV